MTVTELRTTATTSKAWPFEEARRLLKRYPNGKPDGSAIVFECGYGPSGLPHIGTFNEVLRTTMVRNAFATLSDAPTRLIEFSDDMDGLRKVPRVSAFADGSLGTVAQRTASPKRRLYLESVATIDVGDTVSVSDTREGDRKSVV